MENKGGKMKEQFTNVIIGYFDFDDFKRKNMEFRCFSDYQLEQYLTKELDKLMTHTFGFEDFIMHFIAGYKIKDNRVYIAFHTNHTAIFTMLSDYPLMEYKGEI